MKIMFMWMGLVEPEYVVIIILDFTQIPAARTCLIVTSVEDILHMMLW